MQDVKVKNVKENEKIRIIEVELERKQLKYSCCKSEKTVVHEYGKQIIKDVQGYSKDTYIHLNKRRYKCKECGKRFLEKNNFLAKYQRITKRLLLQIYEKTKEVRSYSSIARELGLSTTTVIRLFDIFAYPEPKEMPTSVAIDEFKGNARSEKYQCIITAPENKRVLDILQSRSYSNLSSYFFNKKCDKTANFVSDMWKPFSNIATQYFKNSQKIVDKYHFIRQVSWAFEKVRKTEQKKFSKDYRIYFKRSRWLLIKRFNSLTDEHKQQVNIMLYASCRLSSAYFYKESFYDILRLKDRKQAAKEMGDWINDAINGNVEEMKTCAKTLYNWFTDILNSFSKPLTNGFTEGCNNKIKVLKRNAYSVRNFKRFRNRILHIFSEKNIENTPTIKLA